MFILTILGFIFPAYSLYFRRCLGMTYLHSPTTPSPNKIGKQTLSSCFINYLLQVLPRNFFFIEVPVQSQESERSCICVLGVSLYIFVSTIVFIVLWSCFDSLGCVQHRSCQVELRRKILLNGKIAQPLHSSSQLKKCLLAFESKMAAKTKFNFVR